MDSTIKTAPKPRGKPFPPGNNANPNGRPKGSRNKLQEDFVKALADDFEKEGVTAIQNMRATDPSGYIKTIASLCPKQVEINETSELSADDLLDIIATLNAAISGERGSGKAVGQGTPGKQAHGVQTLQ